MKPRLGQRVLFMRHDHPQVRPGTGGMVELLSQTDPALFFVLTDCGGFYGWTDHRSWAPTDEPDETLTPEFRTSREAIKNES